MSPDEQKTLHTFEAGVRQLILQYGLLRKQMVELQSMLEQKDAKIADLEKVLAEKDKSYTDLKLAKMMEIGDDDVKNAKQKISKLIREVDKCIALLNV